MLFRVYQHEQPVQHDGQTVSPKNIINTVFDKEYESYGMIKVPLAENES